MPPSAARQFTPWDLIVLIVIGIGAIAFLLPLSSRLGEDSKRVRCARNLRCIGQAIFLYANESKGNFPRGKWDPKIESWPQYTGAATPDPFGTPGPEPNDVSAPLFILIRSQEISSEVFICPGSKAEKEIFGGGTNTALNRSNFSSPNNLSYSYANPYPAEAVARAGYKPAMVAIEMPSGKLTSELSPEFALMADINPGTPELLKLGAQSTAQEMKAGNSPNHARDGQNVLYVDGHAEWQSSPFVGVNKDNIYTYGVTQPAPQSFGIVGSPTSADDSVLLPIAASTPGTTFGASDWSRLVLGILFALLLALYLTVRMSRRWRESNPGGWRL